MTSGAKDLQFDNEVLMKQNNDLYEQLSKKEEDQESTSDNGNSNNNNPIKNRSYYESPDDMNTELYDKEEELEESFLTRIDELEKHIQDQSLKRIEQR